MMDLTPLKKYRDYRLLWSSGLISLFGSQMTYVALPFQVKLITGSYVDVALIGSIELIPLIIFGIYGGVLADKLDKSKMIWFTEAACMGSSLILFINSRLHHPHLIVLYIVAALFATFDGLQRPSANAILPRVVNHEDLPSANALMSLRSQVGMIIGPTAAGLILSLSGPSAAYLIDIATFVLSLILLWQVSSVPSTVVEEKPSWAAAIEGFKYAFSRQDLLGTYIIDLIAMFFAMPNALFPFWADDLHSRSALGLFYISGTIGSLVITLFSRSIMKYPFHGKAVIFAASGWAIAVACAGIFHSLALAILFLILAGASDMCSALFRGNIWNQSIPDDFRGRLAGIEMLSYSIGPLAGQMRAGAMAQWGSLHFSIVGGGVICFILIILAAILLPKMRNYDVRTNKFVLAVKKSKENLGESNS
jgi:MFS family permease